MYTRRQLKITNNYSELTTPVGKRLDQLAKALSLVCIYLVFGLFVGSISYLARTKATLSKLQLVKVFAF